MFNVSAFLIFLYFLSRILFYNAGPVFFDSPEYLDRLENPSFAQGLVSGHLPLHAGYILLFWPIYHLAVLVNLNPSVTVIIVQILLSFSAVLAFYYIVKSLFNYRIAIISAIIISLIPIFWISNITIMMETTYVSTFILCLLFLTKYTYQNKNNNLYLFLFLLAFIISFLTHLIIILWIPFMLFFVYQKNKEKLISFIFILVIAVLLSSLINGYFIAVSNNANIYNGIKAVYISKLGENVGIMTNINGFLSYFRNLIIPLFRNNTLLISVISLFGLISLFINNKKLFFLLLLWAIPSVITNQWWDSLLFGRHSLISSFGLSTLVATVLYKRKFLFYIVLIYLVVTVLPAIILLNTKIPYIEEAKVIETLPSKGLLIESHFARPQIDKVYRGDTIFVEEPGWNKTKLAENIKQNLREQKPVFISSQALSEPYGLYSGPYLHSLSLSYKKDYVLKNIITDFTLKEYKTISRRDNLIIYKIISSKQSSYPEITNLKYSKRRLDYHDPFMQLWFVINNHF